MSDGEIKASGNITFSLIIIGQYLKADQVIVSGTICSDNGLLARDNAGQIFSCVNSKWQLVGDQPGTIKMWGATTAPNSYLDLNSQAFDKVSNPILTSLYPSGKLPDFRGQFVRAWDHGAGVDSESNRAMLSSQSDAIRNITGSLFFGLDGNISQSRLPSNLQSGATYYDTSVVNRDFGNNLTLTNNMEANRWILQKFDASRQVPTASENRPKNIAVMYIIKKVDFINLVNLIYDKLINTYNWFKIVCGGTCLGKTLEYHCCLLGMQKLMEISAKNGFS